MRSSRGLKGKRVGTEKQLDVNLTTPPHGVSLHSRQTVQHLNAFYVSFNCRSFIFVRLLFSTSSSLFLFCSLIRYNLDYDLHVLASLRFILQSLLLPSLMAPYKHHQNHRTETNPDSCHKSARPAHPNSVGQRNDSRDSSCSKGASDQVIRG
jgi:hypothetical protein